MGLEIVEYYQIRELNCSELLLTRAELNKQMNGIDTPHTCEFLGVFDPVLLIFSIKTLLCGISVQNQIL